jgi:hypothetical protein
MTEMADRSRYQLPKAPELRYTRRLSDKILIAFHCACDQANIEVAEQLLRVLEFMVKKEPRPPAGKERRSQDDLVAAHLRLWLLKHPEVLAE